MMKMVMVAVANGDASVQKAPDKDNCPRISFWYGQVAGIYEKIQWNGICSFPRSLTQFHSLSAFNSMLLFFGWCINNTIWSEFQTAECTSTNRNFEIGPCLYIWTMMRVCVYTIWLCPVWIWGAFVDLFSFVSICFQWEWLSLPFSFSLVPQSAEKDRHYTKHGHCRTFLLQ